MSQRTQYGNTGTIGFVALTVGNIVSVTMLIWLSAKGRSVLVVFPFSVGAWGCYMCSHYLVEGGLIDRSESNPELDANGEAEKVELSNHLDHLPSSFPRKVLAIGGVGSMVMTFPTGIVAVGGNDLTLLVISATLFTGGYILGHQGFTGKPL
jgi:hypothetical protein